MECTLKRVLDYKLVFDVLSDTNGLVRLDTLQKSWPGGENGTLPRGCLELWSQLASPDGYLDWDTFSAGMERALKADRFRLGKGELSSPSKAEQTLHALQRGLGREGRGTSLASSEEMELFLSSCEQGPLVQALARTRKDVYNCQRSLHTLTSSAATVPTRKSTTNQVRRWSSIGAADSIHSPIGEVPSTHLTEEESRSLVIGNEREEVMRGLEALQRTERWYRNRLKYLSLEERALEGIPHTTKEKQAEKLLVALEMGCQSGDTMSHIRGINAHLSALAAVDAGSGFPAKQVRNRHSHSLHDLLSAGTPARQHTAQGKAPQRSLSMTPADHTGGRRKVKRSLSLKGNLLTTAVSEATSPQQYPLRAVVSMREFAHSHQHRVAMVKEELPVTREDLSASYPPQLQQMMTAPAGGDTETGKAGGRRAKSRKQAKAVKNHPAWTQEHGGSSHAANV